MKQTITGPSASRDKANPIDFQRYEFLLTFYLLNRGASFNGHLVGISHDTAKRRRSSERRAPL